MTGIHISQPHSRRLRRELINWQADQGFTHFITLAINRPVPVDRARKMFGSFCLEVDRYFHNRRNVQKLSSSARFNAFATIEHENSNIHLHALAKLEGWIAKSFDEMDEDILSDIWEECTNGSGDLDCQRIGSINGVLYYITKEHVFKDPDYILSSDFHPY